MRLPDGSPTELEHGLSSFDGRTRFHTRVTDANGHQQHSYRDVRELILGVVEEGGLTTRYRYDNLKQITQVIDAAGHPTRVEWAGAAHG